MAYTVVKNTDVPTNDKFGIHLKVYPRVGDFNFVIVETEEGHNQEFYDKESTFTYVVLDGEGRFFIDDEEIPVAKGDYVSIEPQSRIYYRGKMRLLLICTPGWKPENEVETRPHVW